MKQMREPGAQTLQTRRQLDDLDSLLERLLELPLPSSSSPDKPSLQLLPDLESEESNQATSQSEEPPAAVRIDPPHATVLPLEPEPAQEEAARPEEVSSQVVSADSAPPASRVLEPVAASPTIPPIVLPEPQAIPSITLKEPPTPATPWPVACLAWLDRQLTAPLGGWVGHGTKQGLGWLGLLLLAAAAALALGRWLGQRW